VPVPSIRICDWGAAADGAGEAWAKSGGVETNARQRAAALTVRARQREQRANDEQLMPDLVSGMA
jgi:hypothetical protein